MAGDEKPGGNKCSDTAAAAVEEVIFLMLSHLDSGTCKRGRSQVTLLEARGRSQGGGGSASSTLLLAHRAPRPLQGRVWCLGPCELLQSVGGKEFSRGLRVFRLEERGLRWGMQ